MGFSVGHNMVTELALVAERRAVTMCGKLSYERRCQEKNSCPSPQGRRGCGDLHPARLILGGVFGLAAWDGRAFQRRSQPQLLVPNRRFHEAVALDAIRFRSYAS